MKESAKKLYQIISQFVNICISKGLKYAVLSPGSRSAPLALSFIRNKEIRSIIINDERSAAYVALGMAQNTGQPVVLVCTSGTAALNYTPAVAEAFFQKIPLIIFTADRPPEWIGQGENQTIYQTGIYQPNILAGKQVNIFYNDENAEYDAYRTVNELINKSMFPVKGPVHINVPMREPIYFHDGLDDDYPAPPDITIVYSEPVLTPDVKKDLLADLKKYRKILIIAGTSLPDYDLKLTINELLLKSDIVFIPDITSNMQGISKSILQADLLLNITGESDMEYFQPSLLISFGGPMVSKSLRQFLRDFEPKEHWHIDSSANAPDTFQALTRIIQTNPLQFFRFLLENVTSLKDVFSNKYYEKWKDENEQAADGIINTLQNEQNNELYAVSRVVKYLPKDSILQLGNSMPVRLVSTITLKSNPYSDYIKVFSNRGTSGIDGCLSTAVGTALSTNETVTVILGDQSFFYDRNALWNKHLPANIKIIVLNNHGGGIFKTLKGPSQQPEFTEYFIAGQPITTENTVLQHNLHYLYCDDLKKMDGFIEELYLKNDKAVVLEIDFK
jgi:2-succinyl-5-enolpyruvyl-6-hydroxy-3-cyclohexene-1-carboxylate synthase